MSHQRPPGTADRWLVAGYVAFSVAVPVVFFALARYRLPVEMMLLVFGASWLADRTATLGPMVASTARDVQENAQQDVQQDGQPDREPGARADAQPGASA